MLTKQSIPAIRPVYLEEELKDLPAEQRLAATFGVPSSFLYLANNEHVGSEGYRIHQYVTFYLPKIGALTACHPNEQFDSIASLLNDTLVRKPPGLVVINSYPTFFGLDSGSGELFLYHLACSLAKHRIQTRDTNLDFHYLGLTEVEQERWSTPKPKSVFAWGPITDDFVNFMYVNGMKFLFTYTQYTRILLLSVCDVSATLTRLRVAPDYPKHVFQLGTEQKIAKANKDKEQRKEEKKAEFIAEKKKPGRSKGSKNRPKTAESMSI